jgi:hypothetical protein
MIAPPGSGRAVGVRGPERALAAGAHLAVLLPGAGAALAAAAYVYARRRRLAFAADQAARAAAYQTLVWAGLTALALVGGGGGGGALHLAAMAYGAYGAFAALDGRYFRYGHGSGQRLRR